MDEVHHLDEIAELLGDPNYEIRWKPGADIKISPIDANAELQRIKEEHGDVYDEVIVEEAGSPTSPLHSEFEWDDPTAAHEYRRTQARQLMRSLVIVYKHPDTKEPRTVRAWEHVRTDTRKRGACNYVPIQEIMKDRPARESFMETAYRELEAWLDRWEDLEAISDLASGVGRLLSRVRRS